MPGLELTGPRPPGVHFVLHWMNLGSGVGRAWLSGSGLFWA